MTTKALLARLEAKPGKEDAVEEFLRSALPLVEQEPGTKPWFAVRFG
ncbi:MAG: antibiotic biosynthesis monooxygenase, partial [Mycobacterium sp.]